MIIFESIHIIRFPDCDPFNHLNNARYLDYFHNAREDHLTTHYQFNVYEFALKTGKSWVVSQNQIAYIKPAFLMEKVCIQTRNIAFGERDALVEMLMWNESKTTLKSILWSTYVHIDLKTQRSIPYDEYLIQLFSDKVYPLDKKIDFEKRVEQLKGH
ncbi:MAG: acyl-CoA thioesterase [Bacteroidota bacterium]|nr:acyl-CoA thioesterase [Bacteroidota bacterium]